MKKQSEAEWLAELLLNEVTEGREYFYQAEREMSENKAQWLIAALKRRGWAPPKKGKGKK